MNKPPWAFSERRENEGVQIREAEKTPGILTEKKKDEKRKRRSRGRRWKEKASNKQHWQTINASLVGENCQMTAGRKPDELRHCHAAGVTAGMERLLERRHPAERACLQISNCYTACRPQPLFIPERHMKLMMVVQPVGLPFLMWFETIVKKWIFGENRRSLEKLLFRMTYNVTQYKTVYAFSPVLGMQQSDPAPLWGSEFHLKKLNLFS